MSYVAQSGFGVFDRVKTSIGALGANEAPTTQQILSDGLAAFSSMGARGAALMRLATNEFEQERGRQLVAFVGSKLPLFTAAIANGDGVRVKAIQSAMGNILRSVEEEGLLRDAVVKRWLMFAVSPVLALLPASAVVAANNAATNVLDKTEEAGKEVAEAVREALKTAAKETPWWVYLAGGLGVAVAIAYVVRSFR